MRRFAVLVVAILVAIPGGAVAAKTRTIKTTGVIKGHDAQPAAPDGSYAFAGFVSDKKAGEGAITTQGTIEGTSSTGTFTSFFDKGTQRGTFTLSATLNADGTVSVTGTTKVKGGTGAYRGARGGGTLTGTIDAEGYTTFEYANTVKLPKR